MLLKEEDFYISAVIEEMNFYDSLRKGHRDILKETFIPLRMDNLKSRSTKYIRSILPELEKKDTIRTYGIDHPNAN
jgi:hypothetical protein